MCWGVGLPSSEKLVNPRGGIRAYLNSLLNTLPNIFLNTLLNTFNRLLNTLLNMDPQTCLNVLWYCSCYV